MRVCGVPAYMRRLATGSEIVCLTDAIASWILQQILPVSLWQTDRQTDRQWQRNRCTLAESCDWVRFLDSEQQFHGLITTASHSGTYSYANNIFIFIHHKGSDKNNNNSEEKKNNLTKQRNRVTCKFLNEFLIPFYQQYTRQPHFKGRTQLTFGPIPFLSSPTLL